MLIRSLRSLENIFASEDADIYLEDVGKGAERPFLKAEPTQTQRAPAGSLSVRIHELLPLMLCAVNLRREVSDIHLEAVGKGAERALLRAEPTQA